MNFTNFPYQLLGLPDHIRSAMAGVRFIMAHRGPRRTRRGRPVYRPRYIKVLQKDAESLFRHLWSDKFFDFFYTNGGFAVYLHQIKCFYCSGGAKGHDWHGYTAPMNRYECHHINGNTLDNRPDNLIMLSVDDHKEVTKRQRGLSRSRIKKHTTAPAYFRTEFNRRGKPIRNHNHFLANIVAMTLFYTFEWLHGYRGRIKDMVNWISRYINRLGLSDDINIIPDTSFLPNPIFEPS